MKMYDFNQSLYSSLPNISDTEKEEVKKIIIDYLEHNPSKYYMMLNNESHYYTVYSFPHGFLFDQSRVGSELRSAQILSCKYHRRGDQPDDRRSDSGKYDRCDYLLHSHINHHSFRASESFLIGNLWMVLRSKITANGSESHKNRA